MRWLVFYIRSMFCAHKWSYEQIKAKETDEYGKLVRFGPKVSATCNKCGWHRSYWQF